MKTQPKQDSGARLSRVTRRKDNSDMSTSGVENSPRTFRPVSDLGKDSVRQRYDHFSRLFERPGCRDCPRFDDRADSKGFIKLLEVKPIPEWCWDGIPAFMAEYAGMHYVDRMQVMVEAGQARYRQQAAQR